MQQSYCFHIALHALDTQTHTDVPPLVAKLMKTLHFKNLMHCTQHPLLVTCQDRSAMTNYTKNKQYAQAFFFFCEPENLPILTINLLKES